MRAPCVGPVTTSKVISSPSASDPVSVIPSAVSSGVETDCGSATGAEFSVLIVTVSGALKTVPSQTMSWTT